MSQVKISSEHKDYKEIDEIFNFLKSFIRENSSDTSKPGLSGWSDEEHRNFHDLVFKINDGGYSSTIISLKYDFNIMSGYQFDIGSYFIFWNGNVERLKRCFEDITIEEVDKTELH